MKKLLEKIITYFIFAATICVLLSLKSNTEPQNSENNFNDYLVPDFMVSENVSPINNEQINCSISSTSSGTYFIVWEDPRGGIFGQLVTAGGLKIGKNFQINEDNTDCWNPNIYSNGEEYTCVVWTQYRSQTGGLIGRAQLYDPDGNKIEQNFTITESPFATCLTVNVLNNRKFVASWIDNIFNPSPWIGYQNELYIKLFNEEGDSISGQIHVNNLPESVGFSSTLSYDSNDNILVCWDNESYDCYFQLFNSEGNPIGTNIQIDDGDKLSAYSYASFLANDDIIIAWWEHLEYSSSIYAQIFNNDGTPKSLKFKVNSAGEEFSYSLPIVGILGQDEFIIVWQDNRSGNWDIYVQRYKNNGTPVGINFMVNDDTTSESQGGASIVSNENQFAIAWQDNRDPRWSLDIYFQRYLLDGQKLGPNQKLNDDYRIDHQYDPDISGDSNGNAIIVWEDDRYGNLNIYSQRLDSNGQLRGENVNLNSNQSNYTYTQPAVSMNDSGNFVVVWSDYRYDSYGGDIYAQRYDRNGIEIGTDIKINDDATTSRQNFPDVVVDDVGNFVVVWSDQRRENAYSDIYCQRVSNNGDLLSNNFLVNEDQRNWMFRGYPSISMNSKREFVICWQDGGTAGGDIFIQKYNIDGSKLGENLIINDKSSEPAYKPRVILNDSDKIVVAWYDKPRDIYKQILSSNLEKIGPNLKVNDDINSRGQAEPDIAIGSEGDYIICWEDSRSGESEIYGQYYSNADEKINGNFRISTNPVEIQLTPKSLITNGHIITTWATKKSNGVGEDIWANVIEKTVNSTPPINQPSSFVIYQNYPNPFNPATTIRYQIPQKSFVTIKVYDALGNGIQTLVNEEKSADNYEVGFDGTGFSSGIYFYQIKTGNYVATKKMVLLK